MAKIEDCPGFETFGADVKAARKAKRWARRTLAEMVSIDSRYLANIENKGTIPSVPVVIQLISICGLPSDRYFNSAIIRSESELRQRVSHSSFFLSDYLILLPKSFLICSYKAVICLDISSLEGMLSVLNFSASLSKYDTSSAFPCHSSCSTPSSSI